MCPNANNVKERERGTMKKPMKAPSESITDAELENLTYPIVGSPKLDGFRCTKQNGIVLTSSLKPFPNPFIQKALSDLPDYFDGELIVGPPNDPNVFNNTSGPLRRHEGEPDFRFYVFDNFTFPTMSYEERFIIPRLPKHSRILRLVQEELRSPQDVIDFDNECVEAGYEGTMIRSLSAPYKHGRATAREAYIFKRKGFEDFEARVIGFEEQMENTNEKFTNEMGHSKRSSCKIGLVGKNTLGAFIMKSKKWKDPFRVGGGQGMTAELRKHIWEHQDEYLNSVWTLKYQKYGSIDAPRIPILRRHRPDWDITEEI
jgi:DNA ligase 1